MQEPLAPSTVERLLAGLYSELGELGKRLVAKVRGWYRGKYILPENVDVDSLQFTRLFKGALDAAHS